MSRTAKNPTSSKNITVAGLEELFTDTVDQAGTNLASTEDQAWTLTEAADAYNVTERTIRRWIKEQVLSAWKVDGPRGPEWRIDPGSTPDQEPVQPGSTVNPETIVELEPEETSPEIERLWDMLKEKDAKIEALILRTGYLQHQVESQQEEIKLLTDSQHKQTWWQNWLSKFKK